MDAKAGRALNPPQKEKKKKKTFVYPPSILRIRIFAAVMTVWVNGFQQIG